MRRTRRVTTDLLARRVLVFSRNTTCPAHPTRFLFGLREIRVFDVRTGFGSQAIPALAHPDPPDQGVQLFFTTLKVCWDDCEGKSQRKEHSQSSEMDADAPCESETSASVSSAVWSNLAEELMSDACSRLHGDSRSGRTSTCPKLPLDPRAPARPSVESTRERCRLALRRLPQ